MPIQTLIAPNNENICAFCFLQSHYHGGVEVAQHWGAAVCEVAPRVDVEAMDAGAEAGDGAAHLDLVTTHRGEHNPALNGVSLHDGDCRLDLGSDDTA